MASSLADQAAQSAAAQTEGAPRAAGAGAALRMLVSIPCLNEAKTVGDVIRALPRTLPGVGAVDVLVVDDGSTDATAEVARAAGATVRSHGRNRGVGASFQTALDHAVRREYDILCTIDADGQFSTDDVPRLVAPIVEGSADFVTGSRFADGRAIPNMSAAKRWGNARMSNLISQLVGRRFVDVSCGFRAYGREAILHLNLHGDFTYTQETFLQLSFKGLRIDEVPVEVRYFSERKSRVAHSILRYALKTSAIIFAAYRDYRPIQFFWGLAAVFIGTGALVSSVMLVNYLTTGMFRPHLWSGFTGGFLVSVGLVALVLGIIADMLDRVRKNQERILYHLKRDGRGRDTGGGEGDD